MTFSDVCFNMQFVLNGTSKILKDGFIVWGVCDTVRQIVEKQVWKNRPKSVLVMFLLAITSVMLNKLCVSGSRRLFSLDKKQNTSLGVQDILCHVFV